MNKRLQVFKYLLADYFSALIAWILFFAYRKLYIESVSYGFDIPVELNNNFYWGILIIPFYWISIYLLSGTYNKIYRKSRFKELIQTITQTLIGVLILFFVVLLDDYVINYQSYYYTVTTLILLHFGLTFLGRFILTSITKYKISHRIIGFTTILVGSNKKALDLYNELEQDRSSQGYRFIGFVSIDDNDEHQIATHLPKLGSWNDLGELIQKHNVEEIIIAIETSQHDKLNKVINLVDDYDVVINIVPDMYDILSGSVKMNHLFGTPLIQIYTFLMPPWQQFVKRFADITASLFFLVLLFPIYLFVAIGVRLSSRGPIFFRQRRIGLHAKPFLIYKFRSMYVGSESNGPQLSSENDSRITPFGRFIRKIRLDELPQFYNVLIGDMSLVGPRPERQYFIDQIVKIAPHYHHLHKVRPGITSWGQVKYGYAENVNEMLERLKYDVIYIENMSLALDIKILFYTILIVIQGRGK